MTNKADFTCIKKIARKRFSKITISRSFITAKNTYFVVVDVNKLPLGKKICIKDY